MSLMYKLEEGKSCHHPGCLHHVTKPCDGCGRIAGRTDPNLILQHVLFNHTANSSINRAVALKLIPFIEVDEETGCWIWTGSRSGNGRGGGYGRVCVHGRTSAVHRVVWSMVHGFLPLKKQIHHKCDNRPCCNPEHLKLTTHKQNQRYKK